MKSSRPKLDWSTVEMVSDPRAITSRGSFQSAVIRFPSPRASSSTIRRILAGASMKARAAGALRTHAQICRLLEPGLEVLSYGWGLVVAAMMEDLSRSIDAAAYVICGTSARLAASIALA